jgi:hypothetical protein
VRLEGQAVEIKSARRAIKDAAVTTGLETQQVPLYGNAVALKPPQKVLLNGETVV